jgi:hypothetical protein
MIYDLNKGQPVVTGWSFFTSADGKSIVKYVSIELIAYLNRLSE